MSALIIPSNFIIKFKNISWHDFEYALDKNIILEKTLVDYAIMKISLDRYSDLEFELASCNPKESCQVLEIFYKLLENKSNQDEIAKKWTYFCLLFIYENKGDFDDPLGIIEDLYSDFDYPEYIKQLVRYMPSDDGRLVDFDKEWRIFLDNNSFISK